MRMTDQDAVRAIDVGPETMTIKTLDGVLDLAITCTTVDECKENISRSRG